MKLKKIIAMLMAVIAMMALAACSGNTANNAAEETAAPEVTETVEAETVEAGADAQEASFTEIPIWEDEEIGFLNVSGVYFQPVSMSNGNESIEGYAMHFEADVSTLANDLVYGIGEWVPYMTVDYVLTGKDTGTVVSGTFMPMNADDGPHYGANIEEIPADTYSVKLTFHSPEENGYLIHLDEETGPGGALTDYDWPLVLELNDVWDYAPVEW